MAFNSTQFSKISYVEMWKVYKVSMLYFTHQIIWSYIEYRYIYEIWLSISTTRSSTASSELTLLEFKWICIGMFMDSGIVCGKRVVGHALTMMMMIVMAEYNHRDICWHKLIVQCRVGAPMGSPYAYPRPSFTRYLICSLLNLITLYIRHCHRALVYGQYPECIWVSDGAVWR